jgi:hypothetical protein
MGTEQKHVPASATMDARNFLRAINNSAQSKVLFFESVVTRLGQEAKKNFRLTALHPASLIFEDVDSKAYYSGDIKKDGARYTVDNIKRIKVVEEKKADLFDKNCKDLVDAISENNYRGAEKAFDKISAQRFRSRVIPESGWVTTRDGEARQVNVEKDIIEEDRIPQIIEAFVNAVSDSVEVSEGQVVSGTFTETGEDFTIPVDEFTRRRIVARRMRGVAESAYSSPSFQGLVKGIAGLVCEQKVAEAVEMAAKFLRTEQEFCLLDKKGMAGLVESALSSQMEFNPFLIEDVATLMYKTNLKVNEASIIECWTKTAEKAQSPELLTKAKSLGESKNFASDYEVFLEGVFTEATDIDSNRAKAYLVAMKTIKSVLGHIQGQEQLTQDIDNIVSSLESEEPSTDVIFQAEELLAGIGDQIIDRVQALDSFDRMPGAEDEEKKPEGEEEPPVPLPEAGDEEKEPAAEAGMGAGPAGSAAPAGPAGPGAAGAPAPAPAPAAAPLAASKQRGAAISESEMAPVEKMSTIELQEELEKWRTDGHIYLKEDGFEDCFNQLNRLIDRSQKVNSKQLREEFERIRDVVIDQGNDVSLDLPEDPYEGKVDVITGGKIRDDYVAEEIGGMSAPGKMLKHGGDNSGASELQGGGGVAKSSTKSADGRKGDGAQSNDDPTMSVGKGKYGRTYGRDDTTMSDELQGKTKGVADKTAKSVSGRDGSGASGAEDYTQGSGKGKYGRSYSHGETDMADELQDKTDSVSESFIDKLASTLDEDYSKQTGASHADGGGSMKGGKGEFGRNYGEGETGMGDEHQQDKHFGHTKKASGSEGGSSDQKTGVSKSGLSGGTMKQPKGELGRSYGDGETDMSDEHQQDKHFGASKKTHVKEDIDQIAAAIEDDSTPVTEPESEAAEAPPVEAEAEQTPEADVSETPQGEGEPAAAEDQQKGPRMRAWGRKKSALAPREVKEGKESEKKAVKEDVAVAFSTDERLDDVIVKVMDAMRSHEEGSEGMPPVPPPPGGEMGGMEPAPVGDMPDMGGEGAPEGPPPGLGGEGELEGEEEAGGPPPEVVGGEEAGGPPPELAGGEEEGEEEEEEEEEGAPAEGGEEGCPECKCDPCECPEKPKEESFDKNLDKSLATVSEAKKDKKKGKKAKAKKKGKKAKAKKDECKKCKCEPCEC